MSILRSLVVVGSAVVSCVLAVPGAALASVAPPDGVVLEVVAAGGTGCPPGTAGVSIVDGGFSVAYSAFAARVGVGATRADARKNCQISLLVHAPEGYRYAITGVDHLGSAHLEPGASAAVRTRYYFSGQVQTATISHSFAGPFDGDWQTVDDVDIASRVFSPCGAQRNLNINTDVTVSAGTSNPATTTSSLGLDQTVSDVYRFVWDQCA